MTMRMLFLPFSLAIKLHPTLSGLLQNSQCLFPLCTAGRRRRWHFRLWQLNGRILWSRRRNRRPPHRGQGRSGWIGMLKDPVMIGGAALEMSDDLRKVVLLEGRSVTLASNSHDAAGRASDVFPVAMGHRVGVCFPEKGLGQACQLSQ